ncbi:hypothetical protein [Streptomyces sp. NPDC088727]|uniref:hypothetical protein n=1 Tax=Streptomyces sp. NPDC088727 TaxID=3365875 RepID=UPI00381F0168
MSTTASALRWERDKNGETLWLGEQFLGCTYSRDNHLSEYGKQGWRALEGEDMIVVGDALPTGEQPNARLGARALLEAHVGSSLPLPTAEDLLKMGSTPVPARFRFDSSTITWKGVDSDTPPGHITAFGTDSLGTRYLWLFKGDAVTDDSFVGSILLHGDHPVAYDSRGSFAGLVQNMESKLDDLVERYNRATKTS